MSRRARAAAPPALRITYMCIHTSARYRFRDTASQGHRDSPYNVKTLCSRLTLSSDSSSHEHAVSLVSLRFHRSSTCHLHLAQRRSSLCRGGQRWVVPEPRSAQRHHTTAMRITMRRRAPPLGHIDDEMSIDNCGAPLALDGDHVVRAQCRRCMLAVGSWTAVMVTRGRWMAEGLIAVRELTFSVADAGSGAPPSPSPRRRPIPP